MWLFWAECDGRRCAAVESPHAVHPTHRVPVQCVRLFPASDDSSSLAQSYVESTPASSLTIGPCPLRVRQRKFCYYLSMQARMKQHRLSILPGKVDSCRGERGSRVRG